VKNSAAKEGLVGKQTPAKIGSERFSGHGSSARSVSELQYKNAKSQ
jgi:hypothetical protein